MPLYSDIQNAIDMGKGFAAQVLGPPHDVYRMTAQDASGNVLIPGNKIATAVPIFSKIAYGSAVRTSFEGERQQGIIWYEIIADMRPYLVGDIFKLNDPVFGAGYSSVNFESDQYKGLVLADHSPIKKTLGGRLSTTAQIFRLNKGTTFGGNWSNTLKNSKPVVLAAGVFSIGQTGQMPCNIPVGLMSTGKSYGDRLFDQKPGDQRKSGWEMYVPPLNGFDVQEGDRIVAADGSRYVVIVPYTQKIGASGSQWFLEREDPG